MTHVNNVDLFNNHMLLSVTGIERLRCSARRDLLTVLGQLNIKLRRFLVHLTVLDNSNT